MPTEVANKEQAASWDGDDGEHWTQYERIYNGSIERHHQHFMRAAAIGPADRVLDIGCGTGRTTSDAARAASEGSALGVDLSARMLERAREHAREQGLTNVAYEQTDAQVHPFAQGAFDVALSRCGSMFFNDHTAAFRNIGRALPSGGRLVLLTWRAFAQNVWIRKIRDAFAAGRQLPDEPSGRPGPFGLADEGYVRSCLSNAGFADISLTPIDEPIWFGTTLSEALDFWKSSGMSRGLLHDADESLRAKAFDALHELFAAHETDHGVLLDSSAWLITARNQ
jgi:ubiquinone/menaquinone biosynthesis C-methylase UbiE